MPTETTAEMVAASDANETTPSDTPLTKLLARQNLASADDGEALLRIMTLVETLLRERRSLRSTGSRMALELVAAAFFGTVIAIFMLFRIEDVLFGDLGIPALGALAVVLAFMGMRVATLRDLAAERRKNKRLTGKAVEFVREYAALTRADRSPAEEAEIQLRLEQIGIEPLDRPM